jgi:hypothetical protein
MKKLAISLMLAGVLSFLIPIELTAADDPCATTTLTYPDGTQHIVMICDVEQDTTAWAQLLCGLGDDER